MKTKTKDAPASRFTRGERISGKSRHGRKAASSRRSERSANSGDVTHVPDADVPPA
jgi:hypothetical protein